MGKETISRKTIAKGVVSGVVALASLGALQVGEYTLPAEPTEAETSAETEASAAETDAGAESVSYENGFTPGTYTASAKGMESDVTAVCTFDETSLTDVSLDVSGETQDIGAATGDELTAALLSAQSPEIDGVSGATVTSTAVKTAVSDCFAQAAVDSGDTEQPAETEAEAEDDDAAAGENGTEAAEESDAAEEADANAAGSAGDYTPGTYTASAKGLESDVTAICTFDETGLTAISLDVSEETPDIGGAIGDEMIAAILNAQSAEVDGVSGATVTSTAVKTAVSECFALAAGGSDAAATDTEGDEANTDAAETSAENSAVNEAETEADSAEENEAESSASEENETEGNAAGAYTPGTYTATAAGISSDVTVTLTLDESAITDMTVDVSGETAGIGADIGDTVIEQVLTAQSAEIDGVSGATITSTAVKTAVSECLSQAAAGSSEGEGVAEQTVETETAEAADTDAETTETAEIETEAAADEETTDAAEIETEAAAEEEATDAAEIETEAAAEEEATDAAEIETEAAAEEENSSVSTGAYTPGTYTASAKGLESDVVAVCTFDEAGLTAISLDVSGETPDIGGAIGTEMSSAILNAQSAEVDGVSGATVTSTAVKTAVSECFAQAAGSSEAEAADSGETEEATEAAAEKETEAAEETETVTAAEAETAEAAVDTAEAETAAANTAQTAGSYTPGTYTATASSLVGDVTAFCTFSESGLIAIGLDVPGGIADTLSRAILHAQSAEVDSVSGAPEASAAVMEAVQSCFDQAAAEG